MLDLPPRTKGDSRHLVLIEHLTRGQIVQYAGASGDFNPLHIDEEYARKVAGFPSVFAHGMLTMGITAKAIVDLYGMTSLKGFGGRFKAKVWPGDSLTAVITVCDAESDGQLRLSVQTMNQDQVVVFEGTATVSAGN